MTRVPGVDARKLGVGALDAERRDADDAETAELKGQKRRQLAQLCPSVCGERLNPRSPNSFPMVKI